MKLTAAVLAALLLPTLDAHAATPERQVRDNVIVSARDPAVRIELPAGARYVGASRWTLYDVADCELHVFIEADELKRVQRLYWIQFEGFIPSRPELHYDYSDNAATQFAGRTFFVNANPDYPNGTVKPGSDFEAVRKLVRSNGYSLHDDSVNVRLVNLFADKRKELMFIYAENLEPLGFTSDELMAGGRAEKQWPEVRRQIEENAKNRIKVEWRGER